MTSKRSYEDIELKMDKIEMDKIEMERIENIVSTDTVRKITDFRIRNSIDPDENIYLYTNKELSELVGILRDELELLSANKATARTTTFNKIIFWIKKLRGIKEKPNRDDRKNVRGIIGYTPADSEMFSYSANNR